jgi:hypothetical protein
VNIHKKEAIDVLVTAVALIEDCGAFVCTTQLLGVVADLLATALLAGKIDDTGRVHVILGNGLNFGSLCAQGRGKRSRLGVRNDCF